MVRLQQRLAVAEQPLSESANSWLLKDWRLHYSGKKWTVLLSGCLDGNAEAHLIALACSQPPKGRNRWLNTAEIEMRVMARRCLTERIDNIERLEHQAVAWAQKRNTKQTKVNWQFTTADAGIKPKKLYPSIE